MKRKGEPREETCKVPSQDISKQAVQQEELQQLMRDMYLHLTLHDAEEIWSMENRSATR